MKQYQLARSAMVAATLIVIASIWTDDLNAGIVLNWGGDMVGGDKAFLNDDGSGTNGSKPYEDPILPDVLASASIDSSSGRIFKQYDSGPDAAIANAANRYSPIDLDINGQPVYTGSPFYGGHVVQMAGDEEFKTKPGESINEGLDIAQIINQGPTDKLHVSTRPDDRLKGFAMLTYWNSDQLMFTGGNSEYSANLDTVLSLKSTQDNTDKPPGAPNTDPTKVRNNHTLRFVLQIDNSEFYLSRPFDFFNNNEFVLRFSDDPAWEGYGVVAGNSLAATGLSNESLINSIMRGAPTSLDVPSGSVTGIGFYVEYMRSSKTSGANDINYKIFQFNANGETVPEPGTFALGLVGVTGAALRRWKKRRSSNQLAPQAAQPAIPETPAV